MIGMSRLKKNNLIRKEMYSIEEVLSKVTPIHNDRKEDLRVDFDGDLMKMNSHRYHNFLVNGTNCVTCGIEGKYFVKEKSPTDNSYHFNLYAINNQGHEVLMTKDHIVPKSKGGPNRVENYQPMCTNCNHKKGIMSQEEFEESLKVKS